MNGAENIIYLSPGQLELQADQEWAELSEQYDADEAAERFLAWRETHRSIGYAALDGVDNM